MNILPQHWLRSAAGLAHQQLKAALPCSCLLCGADSRTAVVCLACLKDLPGLPRFLCPTCAEPTTHGERCGRCLNQALHFEQTIAPLRYDFPVDRLIHALKYGHQLSIAAWCGEKIAACIAQPDFDLIIPLPLHASRLRERGFNQSAEIARTLGRALHKPVAFDQLQRCRQTLSQAELPLRARSGNVRGAFECRKDYRGLDILLVDDVMTSGATLDEAARIVRLHGARRVIVAVVARAIKSA